MVVDPAFWRAKRVLVTGHTGFKGSWLSLWLSLLGADVIGLSDGVPTSPSLYEEALVGREIESHEGDVRELRMVQSLIETHRPEIVFHLAAQALVRRSYREPLTTYETNVLGTANVLEASRGTVSTLIVVTSDKCYEDSASGRPHPETDALGGRDPYSSSKACAELVTAAYRSSFAEGGPVIASVRAGNVIGGGDWAEDRLVPDLVRGALAGNPVPIRNPDAIRPWQHVLNPLEGYLVLGQKMWDDRSFGEAWNFGPDASDETTVARVVARLCERWDELSIDAAQGPEPPEAPTLRLDSTKARTRLGWRPRWGLDEALRRVIEWTLTYRDGGDVRETTLDQIRAHQEAVVAA